MREETRQRWSTTPCTSLDNNDGKASNYNEETDDDKATTFDDKGQFDNAVIKLDEINGLLGGSAWNGHTSQSSSDHRKNRALMGMSTFGMMAGVAVARGAKSACWPKRRWPGVPSSAEWGRRHCQGWPRGQGKLPG